MISVEEAKTALLAHIRLLDTEVLTIPEVYQRYTAEAIAAPYEHPLFDQSAVDGYAFAFEPIANSWEVVGEVAAGSVLDLALRSGQCARIFTGGMLPAGADTVVMQEFVKRDGQRIEHKDEKLRQGANVRLRGEQIIQGQEVLAAGERLSPQAIGLLLSVGVREVKCHRLPRIAVVVTGNEFTDTTTPGAGRIFSSNGEMLQAALHNGGLSSTLLHVKDDEQILRETLRNALEHHDLVITTGGVSVGDLDLVRPVLEQLDTRIIFHGVAQKPGKPMLMGRRGDTLVIGLPGNPRAVLVLFLEFVLPAIRAMQGAGDPWPRTDLLPIGHTVELKGERAEFRAAQVRNGKVKLLQDQGSHMLSSLLAADALVYFPSSARPVMQGDHVEVHYLPY
jgi:molybdopterin molybdotransferase